jgi:hypothetical protein
MSLDMVTYTLSNQTKAPETNTCWACNSQHMLTLRGQPWESSANAAVTTMVEQETARLFA